MKKLLVILTVWTWIAPVYAEKAYKWTDAEGNVQITQTPPPAGAKDIKQMDLPKALMPTTPPVVHKTTSPEKKEEKIEEKPKQPPVDISKMTPEQLHEHNCTSAKRQLEMLKTNEKIVIPDKETNKLHLASSEQREAEIKRAENMVEKFCNAPPPVVSSNTPADKKVDDDPDKKAEKTEKK